MCSHNKLVFCDIPVLILIVQTECTVGCDKEATDLYTILTKGFKKMLGFFWY